MLEIWTQVPLFSQQKLSSIELPPQFPDKLKKFMFLQWKIFYKTKLQKDVLT